MHQPGRAVIMLPANAAPGGSRWWPNVAFVLYVVLLLAAGLVGVLVSATGTERPERQVFQFPPLQLDGSDVHHLTRVQQRDLAWRSWPTMALFTMSLGVQHVDDPLLQGVYGGA